MEKKARQSSKITKQGAVAPCLVFYSIKKALWQKPQSDSTKNYQTKNINLLTHCNNGY